MKDDLRPAFRLRNMRDNRRADGNFVWPHPVNAAHHPRAFFQINQNHVVRLLRRLWVNDGKRIDRTSPARFHPFQRLAFGTGQARREEGGAVLGIALDQKAPLAKRGAPMGFRRYHRVFAHAAQIWRSRDNVNREICR